METILNHFDNTVDYQNYSFISYNNKNYGIFIGKDVVVRQDYIVHEYVVSIQPKKYFGTGKNIKKFKPALRMRLIGVDSNLIFQHKDADFTTRIIEVDMDTYEILSEKKFAIKENVEYSYSVTNGMVYWLNSKDENQYLYKLADSKVYKIRNPIPNNSRITDIITYGRSECDAIGIKSSKKSKFIPKYFKHCSSIIYNTLTKKYIAYADCAYNNIYKINNILVTTCENNISKIIDLRKHNDIAAAQLAVDISALIKDELAETAFDSL